MKRIFILTGIILTLFLLIAFRLSSNKKVLNASAASSPSTNVSIPVKVAEVRDQLLDISIKKTGNLAPFKEAKVLTTGSGILENMPFKLGDFVSEGQVLAQLDTRLQRLDLAKAQTNLDKLRNDWETYSELLAGKAATQEKVNETKQNYEDAFNQYNQAEKQLADAAIKAPTSGIISVKNVEKGMYVMAGTEIATVVNITKIKVQVYLAESEVYLIKQEQPVKVTTDVYPGKVFKGKVTFISPQADAAHNYMVEIEVGVENRYPLYSGTFVAADFSHRTVRPVMLIPREALTESTQNATVYVVSGDKAFLRPIKTGMEMGDQIEVTGGLTNKDIVVVSGQVNLKDSTPISISK